MADISYLEAWQIWMDGQSTLGSDLFGVPMIWLGRSGKIAAFIGGLAVLLDLLGPERLRYGPAIVRMVAVTFVGVVAAALLAWLAIVLAAVTGFLFVLLLGLDRFFRGWFRIMDRVRAWRLSLTPEALERRSRWACLALVVVGFHFDLLAS
ncbi:hypothetical protein [Nonomuraea maritima]|uniref:hypothetical protein n=1 Tax=Nonomuraea maritima TaxID=683260 RepID=UPI003710CE4B